jgi:predicted metal-dependent hydrolase
MFQTTTPAESAAAPKAAMPQVMPTRRDLHFQLPAERIGDWHPAGREVSHFFNAMSLFFPDGERFFIHSVRNYRPQIRDPELNKAVTGFIGQEAMHSREHSECNDLLDAAGLPATPLQHRVQRLLERVKRRLPPRYQLAITIALEHLTAIMANAVLEDERVLAGAEPAYARLWHWHALEETEHKAVAYDVWRAVTRPSLFNYLLRCITLISASVVFWVLVFLFHRKLVNADPAARAERGGLLRLLRFQWITPGPLRRALRDWFDYFRPGFHPWMHDNRRYLAGVEAFADEVRHVA